MTVLSGYILARPGKEKIQRQELNLSVHENNKSFSLEFRGVMPIGDAWESFEFHSSIPLPDDDHSSGGEPVHGCDLIICRSRSRMLLLASKKKIADFVIDNLLNQTLYPNFRKVPIAIDRLIDACALKDSSYAVTSVHGRFSGKNSALRTLILYGEEVTDSSLFRDQHALFNFYAAGVRRRGGDRFYRTAGFDESEIGRLANDGLLIANFKDAERASEVLRFIKYIFDNGWVDNWARGDD